MRSLSAIFVICFAFVLQVTCQSDKFGYNIEKNYPLNTCYKCYGNGPGLCTPSNTSVCAFRGQLKPKAHDAPLTSVTVNSHQQCAGFCLNFRPLDIGIDARLPCSGYGYNRDNGLCQLYHFFYASNFESNSSSPVTYWSSDCYECADPCLLTKEFNLLHNSGFEMDTKHHGPWFFFDAPSVIHKGTLVHPGYKSNTALSFHIGELVQGVALCKLKSYWFSYNARIVRRPGLEPGNSTDVFATFGDVRATHTVRPGRWYNFTSSFRAYGNGDYLLISGPEGYATQVDNVVLHAANGFTTTTGPNLLKNGGFESGQLAPWVVISDNYPHRPHYSVTSPGITHSKYKFSFHQDTVAQHSLYLNNGDFTLTQTITTTPGKLYQLSFDYLSDPEYTGVDGYQEYIKYDIIAGQNSWSVIYPGEAPMSEVAHFARTFSADSTRTKIDIRFFTGDYETTLQRTYIDTIAVREVPSNGNIGVAKDGGGYQM